MKIKKLFLRNFKSYGNRGEEILLDKYPLTVVRGNNGAGKTTIAEALIFALTGTNPSGKLEELVNRVSGKNAEVILEFEKGEEVYTIVRGIKPNVFEFYRNGTPVKSPAGTKSLQETVESITGIKKKGYAGLLFVNSDIFNRNFANMPAAEKRKFLETLIGGEVFEKLDSAASVKKRHADNLVKRCEKAMSVYEKFVLEEKERNETETKAENLEKEIAEKRKILESIGAKNGEKERRRYLELSEKAERAKAYAERIKGFLAAKGSAVPELLEATKELAEEFGADYGRVREEALRRAKEARKEAEEARRAERELSNVEKERAFVEAEGKSISASLKRTKEEEERLVSKYRICVGCPKLNILIADDKKSVSKNTEKYEKRIEELRERYVELGKKKRELEKRVSQRGPAEKRALLYEAVAEYAEKILESRKVELVPEERKELSELEKTVGKGLEDEKRLSRAVESAEYLLNELRKKLKTSLDAERRVRRYRRFRKGALEFAENASVILKELRNPSTRMKLFRRYVPFVVEEAEKILAEFGSDLMVRIDDSGNVEVYRRFVSVPVTSLSKGESLKVNLAVSIAFSKLYEKRFGSVTNIVFIDEIDGILDAKSFSVLLRLLEKLGKNVFLITHRTDWEDYMDKKIPVMEITKERFTKIEFKEAS